MSLEYVPFDLGSSVERVIVFIHFAPALLWVSWTSLCEEEVPKEKIDESPSPISVLSLSTDERRLLGLDCEGLSWNQTRPSKEIFGSDLSSRRIALTLFSSADSLVVAGPAILTSSLVAAQKEPARVHSLC